MRGNEIRLLALDGGGIRGLSSLLILKQLMLLVDPSSTSPPKPCEYFHMIGGTSTGGLIAIMLGRLRMTVDECITAYTALSDKVFQNTSHRLSIKGDLQGRFDKQALEQAIKEIIVGRGLGADCLLQDDPDSNCKVFVCATSKQTSKTVCLTSYPPSRSWQEHLFRSTKIWEACRATSAATSFFDPISIGQFGEEFVDGALGANNPINILWSQAQDVWGAIHLQRRLQCLVSIGTGVPSIKPFRDAFVHIGKSLVAIATETDNTAEQFRRDKFDLINDGRYYRFNVNRGLEDIGLEETKKKKEIVAATGCYLDSQEVFEQLKRCAEKLKLTQESYFAFDNTNPAQLLSRSLKNLHDSFSNNIDSFGLVRFADAATMFRDLDSALNTNQRDSARFLACTHKIDTFAIAFDQYMEFLGIFTRIEDDCRGLLWGLVRHILAAGEKHIILLEIVSAKFLAIAFSLRETYHARNVGLYRRRLGEGAEYTDLANLTALVYVDILEFCQEIYNIFAERAKGPIQNTWNRILWGTSWKPFDVRFTEMQQRLKMQHRLIEEGAKGNHNWERKQLELELGGHVRKQQETNTGSTITEGRKAQDRYARETQSWLSSSGQKLASAYEKISDSRLARSCDWFLERRQYREWRDGLFLSLVGDASRGNTSAAGPGLASASSNWKRRLLSVQAKPGFGKTVLSSAVVNDIEEKILSSITSSGNKSSTPGVAFHYYSAADKSSGREAPGAIFRHFGSQLVSLHRTEWDIMDAATLLHQEANKGRFDTQQASNSHAEAILKLILYKAPTFLLIDGLDECSDPDLLLNLVQGLLTGFDCRVILFGRPEVRFPASFSPGPYASWKLHLESADNMAAIEILLTDELTKLAGEGLISSIYCEDGQHIATLAGRADGMFLWARLLITYLRCPALSPSEREETLDMASMIEGLGALYNKILATLAEKYQEQITVAENIFQWVSAAAQPISSAQLRTALAISPGSPTTDNRLLSGWPDCVSSITRSLVDVDHAGTVKFIHLSLQEFLEKDPSCHPRFSLRNVPEIHSRIATACLSYLVCDIPARPLQLESRSRHTGSPTPMVSQYPFLKYASACWSAHLLKALSSQPPMPQPNSRQLQSSTNAVGSGRPVYALNPLALQPTPTIIGIEDQISALHIQQIYRQMTPFQSPLSPPALPAPPQWIPYLSTFLLNRSNVTVWVEACWTLTQRPPPDLSPLVGALSSYININSLTTSVPHGLGNLITNTAMTSALPTMSIENREMAWILSGLHQLSSALQELSPRSAAPPPSPDPSEQQSQPPTSPNPGYRQPAKKLHTLLSQKPSAIWTEEIVSATDPAFWPVWSGFS